MADWLLVAAYLLVGVLVGAAFWFFVEEDHIPVLILLLTMVFWPLFIVIGTLFLLISIELPPSPLPEIKARRAAIGKERARIRALQDEAELRRLQKARHDLERELRVP